jgi:hypothetical protein
MKLITELTETVEYITEGEGKVHYIKGITLQAEQKNRNGRIYPMAVMEKEVNRYIAERISAGRAYGELNHPQGPTINLDKVSHLFTELVREGNNYIGKARIADTPSGNIVKGLLSTGANLGISSRGLGTLKQTNEAMIVQDDYHIVTAGDIVADPSAPDAFVAGIMENINYYYDETHGSYLPIHSEQLKKEIKKMSLKEIEEQKARMFKTFLLNLK